MAIIPYGTKSAIYTALFGGGNATSDSTIASSFKSQTLNGIEGIPYQFDETVDRRLSADAQLGRKYAEKIYSRMPLLMLVPCKPIFMGDSSDEDKATMASLLLDNSLAENAGGLFTEPGRYYTVQYDFDAYWQYVNIMLSAVATYMGVADINVPGLGKLGSAAYQSESNDDFRKSLTLSSSDVVVYYLDGMETMSRSFSNEVTESSLASQINGFADQANEIKFLFGQTGGFLPDLVEGGAGLVDSVSSALSGVIGGLGGGIVGSLAGKGINTIINGVA